MRFSSGTAGNRRVQGHADVPAGPQEAGSASTTCVQPDNGAVFLELSGVRTLQRIPRL